MRMVAMVLVLSAACEKDGGAPAAARDPIDVPAGIGLPSSPAWLPLPEAPVLAVTGDAVLLDGQRVASITRGEVPAAERPGDGIVIPSLQGALNRALAVRDEALRRAGKPLPEFRDLLLVADRTTPYRLLVNLIRGASTKLQDTGKEKERHLRIGLVVRPRGASGAPPLGQIPVYLPVPALAGVAAPIDASKPIPDSLLSDGDRAFVGKRGQAPPADLPIQPIVAAGQRELVLFSVSGQEGTLQDPALRMPWPGEAHKLTLGLREIASRRWKGRPRRLDSHQIILILEPPASYETLVELAAAVRQTGPGAVDLPATGADGKREPYDPDRHPLFSTILLGMGFE